MIVATPAQAAVAAPCIAPERPFLPQSREDMRRYADLLRADFETYIAEVQTYFRCLDEERARAFVEHVRWSSSTDSSSTRSNSV